MPANWTTTLWTYSLVASGGALGTVARFWFNGLVSNSIGGTFPWGTWLINVTGSFAIGLFATLTGPDGRWLVGSPGRTFFMIGICGGYTTFSSFSLQTLELATRNGEWLKAGAYVVSSVVVCLLAVWLGYAIAMVLNSTKGH